MSELRFEHITLNAAQLGPENPFPSLTPQSDPHLHETDSISGDALYLGYGVHKTILPYTLQDRYTREKQERHVKAAILENDILRAVFLPEYGGRLWSLYHKVRKRELLFRNPVLQFGNLAIRNAWFAGGVEWNFGMIGHSPFTCSPVFCEQLTDSETGTPVLRFYEWERVRRQCYEIDAYLPDGSEFLLVRMNIKNCLDEPSPTYWWSNIAVPETIGTRVIVNADSSYTNDYRGGVSKVDIPYIHHMDATYSAVQQHAVDYFFYVPDERRKYIAALDEQGKGLVQTSTSRLKGRKLFLWGMGNGGRRWQNFLTRPIAPYIEIQAGLGRTQYGCVPMEPNASWSWLEAYGFMEANPETVHGLDWVAARAHVGTTLEHMLPENDLEQELQRTAHTILGQHGTLVQYGSGWAALENERLRSIGQPPLCDTLIFPAESMTEAQKPWLTLLQTGIMPAEKGQSLPKGYMAQPQWLPLLKQAYPSWLAMLHTGVIQYADGNMDTARQAFEESCTQQENPAALYCLAVLSGQSGEHTAACTYWSRAWACLPGNYWILRDMFSDYHAAGKDAQWIEYYHTLPEKLQQNGRLLRLLASAYLALDRIEDCGRLLQSGFEMADLREGEDSLSELWQCYAEKCALADGVAKDEQFASYVAQHYPLPPHLDFRMNAGN